MQSLGRKGSKGLGGSWVEVVSSSSIWGSWVARKCPGAQLASIRQMSRQLSRGYAGEYQADEQAGVARLRWRVSGR